MRVLGIETACDETAAAVVRRDEDGRGEILSNIVLSQTAEHQPYGGVVPEIAARAHVEALDHIITRAMIEANASLMMRSEEHTSELQSRSDLVCRLLLEKKKKKKKRDCVV